MSAPTIHPSAVVSPDADIGDGTSVGPLAVIEAGTRIGRDCVIGAHAVLRAGTVLGDSNHIGHGAILGGDPQDVSFDPATRSGLRVGDHNTIRELATLHRATRPDAETLVGDHNFLMVGAHVGHDCAIGSHVIIANNCLLGGFVTIQDHVFLGGGCVFHQHIRIGEGAITQGNAGFGKDLPPFLIGAGVNRVAGVNSVGLKRAGMPPEQRNQIRALHRLFFREGRSVRSALEAADKHGDWCPPAHRFLQFVREAEKRGICSGPRPKDRDGRTPDGET